MMLHQAILQIELQKLYVPAIKRPLKLARAEADQRPQVGIVIERTGNALLFKRGFQRGGKLMRNELRTQPHSPAQPVQQA